MVSTILDKIVAVTRERVASARAARPDAALRAELPDAPPVRDFFAALASPGSSAANGSSAVDRPVKLIAEIKKASPSKGVIREDFHPVEIAEIYRDNGATCLSVLTDEPFFQGSLEYLRRIRQRLEIPVLRKDFILDNYQLLEARLAGADAVLLIAECLDDRNLRNLHDETIELGMTPLVEFFLPENLPRVLEAGARLVGVNNRDLRTFETDLEHTVRMRREIPDDCLVVGESGIQSHDDAQRLQRAGVDAMLVGEHLMASPDIGQAVRALLGS